MILIQQLKLRIPHGTEQVRSRAARALMIPEQEILELEILRRSIDARKKPELYFIYSLEVRVRDERKVLTRALKNPRRKEQLFISTREIYRFPGEETGARASEGIYAAASGEKMRDDENKFVSDRGKDTRAGYAVDREKTPGAGSAKDGKAVTDLPNRPVVVGAGPAGLFCAYYLALAGRRPLLLERGRCVEERQRDVETFWKTGKLDPSSNVQFGEGGAGTFSDGKLNTLVKEKEGRNRAVLQTFVRFGAKESILYDAKPHIGTDELQRVIRNFREEILRLGGEIRFESQVTDLETDGERITGIVVNGREKLSCSRLVLAIGHSARDTLYMLHDRKLRMEAKPFAVGLRVEHPQTMIDRSQYGTDQPGDLGAAPYKVTAKASAKGGERSVYSFCMCPGGYVVNASSEEGRLAVNGMSYSDRSGKNANSAVIVSVTPEDYPGEGPLSGIAFQRELEEKAYRLGNGRIPVQRYGEFRQKILGFPAEELPESTGGELRPCCKGEYAWADLSGLLPKECGVALAEGMEQFARQIRGFNRPDAVLSGVESRTSSPVRILRDETLQSNIKGVYPCGEGAGYAGGITSAAMDGLRVAEEIEKALRKEESGGRN